MVTLLTFDVDLEVVLIKRGLLGRKNCWTDFYDSACHRPPKGYHRNYFILTKVIKLHFAAHESAACCRESV